MSNVLFPSPMHSPVPNPVATPGFPVPGLPNSPALPEVPTAGAPAQPPVQEGNAFTNMPPEMLAAMLTFSGRALKPAAVGESAIGNIGSALADAVGVHTEVKKTENTSENVTRRTDLAENELAEKERQDKEVNPVEQSLIDYRNAMSKAQKASGVNAEQVKAQEKAKFMGALMEQYPGMTDSQARIAVEMGEKVGYINFPDIFNRMVQEQMAGNMSFDPATLAANTAGADTISGTGAVPLNPQWQATLQSTPLADMETLEDPANADKKQQVISNVGAAAYYQHLANVRKAEGK